MEKKIYISLPITSRKEQTIRERVEAEAAAIYGKQMYIVAANTFKVIDLTNHYKPIE